MPVFAGVDETRIPGAHRPEHAVEVGSPQFDALVRGEASERARRDADCSGSRTIARSASEVARSPEASRA